MGVYYFPIVNFLVDLFCVRMKCHLVMKKTEICHNDRYYGSRLFYRRLQQNNVIFIRNVVVSLLFFVTID